MVVAGPIRSVRTGSVTNRPVPAIDPQRSLVQGVGMDPEPDIHDLARQVAVMEQSMETMQANLTATLEGFRTDQAKLRETMAQRDVEAARRDKDNLRWIVGLFIVAIVIIPVLSNSAAIANLVTLLGS